MSEDQPSPPPEAETPAPKPAPRREGDRKHEVDQYERPPVDDPEPADPDA